jgi:hypothetical protein
MIATNDVAAKQTRNIGQSAAVTDVPSCEAIESSSHSDTYNGLKSSCSESNNPRIVMYHRWTVGPFKGALSGRDTVHVRV